MRIAALLLFFWLSGTRVVLGEAVYLREEAVVAHSWYSCPNKEDLQFLKGLSGKKWRIARSYADVQGCRMLKSGDTAIVADALVSTGDTCLRVDGAAGCYWFPEAYVIPADSPVGSFR
jgi:hypothetical protein